LIFIANYSEYSKTEKFWCHQDFKDTNEFVSGVFENLINILNYCPEINRLIIISNSGCSLSKKDFTRFIDSGVFQSKLIKMTDSGKIPYTLTKSLLKNADIFDENELVVYDEKVPDYHDLHIVANQKLIDFTKGESVITTSNFLTRVFITIVKTIPNLEIYKRAFKNTEYDKLVFDKVDDIQEYLDFISKFEQDDTFIRKIKYYDSLNLSLRFIIECFDSIKDPPRSIATFYKEIIKVYEGSSRKINLVSSEEYHGDYLIDNFIADLENIYCFKFYSYDCLAGTSLGVNNENGIVVFNSHKIEHNKIQEIISEVHSNKFSNKFYIFHSNISLHNIQDPSFKVIKLPSYDHIRSILAPLIMYIIDKSFDIPDFKLLNRFILYRPIRAAFNHIPSLNQLLNELDDLKYGNNFHDIDFTHKDFWYEYYLYIKQQFPTTNDNSSPSSILPVKSAIQTVDKSPIINKNNNEGNEPVALTANDDKPLIPISFKHNIGDTKWEITYSASEEPIEVSYKNNLGIKYLVFLAHYCNTYTKKKIRASDLRKAIYDWEGKNIPNRYKRKQNKSSKKIKLSEMVSGHLDTGTIRSAIIASFFSRSKKLDFDNIDQTETKNQKKLEKLNLGRDYKITKILSGETGFIDLFTYRPKSNFIIKVDDEEMINYFSSYKITTF
jgi:hypothetical protein